MKTYLVSNANADTKRYFTTFKSAVDFANQQFEVDGVQHIYKFNATENGYVYYHSVTFRKVEFNEEGVMSYA